MKVIRRYLIINRATGDTRLTVRHPSKLRDHDFLMVVRITIPDAPRPTLEVLT